MAAATHSRNFCDICKETYAHEHNCELLCDRCQFYTKCWVEDKTYNKYCERCCRGFYNEACYEAHINTVCYTNWRCPHCTIERLERVRKQEMHRCNEYECANCYLVLLRGEDHQCAIKPKKLTAPRKAHQFIIYDFETKSDPNGVQEFYYGIAYDVNGYHLFYSMKAFLIFVLK